MAGGAGLHEARQRGRPWCACHTLLPWDLERDGYRPSTISIPASSRLIFARGIRPMRSSSKLRSRATSCDTLATESFGRPVIRAVSSALPGASAQRRLLVRGTQSAVDTLLRFRASPWTTITGRLNPGPDPVGAGNSAQQTSPCVITTRHAEASGSSLHRERHLSRH